MRKTHRRPSRKPSLRNGTERRLAMRPNLGNVSRGHGIHPELDFRATQERRTWGKERWRGGSTGHSHPTYEALLHVLTTFPMVKLLRGCIRPQTELPQGRPTHCIHRYHPPPPPCLAASLEPSALVHTSHRGWQRFVRSLSVRLSQSRTVAPTISPPKTGRGHSFNPTNHPILTTRCLSDTRRMPDC